MPYFKNKFSFRSISSFIILACITFLFGCEKFESGRIVKLVTGSVSSISYTSCSVQGTIIDVGESQINQHGFCWSDTPDPTTGDYNNKLGSIGSPGNYSADLTGLSANTTYYIRTYIQNNKDIFYGDQKSFKTLAYEKPTVITSPVVKITNNSAQGGGTVIDDGGATITARGLCWSTSGYPTTANRKTTDGNGTGYFTSNITGLAPETLYYVRAYAIHSEDTAYGNEFSFNTYNQYTITDYDGNIYNTVKLGDQVWMAENLRVTHFADGIAIPLVEEDTVWGNLSINDSAYCYFNNNLSNGNTIGALYTWAAAMNGENSSSDNPSGIQGVCPVGWHIPSDTEWKELEMFLGMSQAVADLDSIRGTDEGGKLKEPGTINWISPNPGASHISGFNALPGGYRNYDSGNFFNLGFAAYFWTSTESSSNGAWYRVLSNDNSGVGHSHTYRDYGFSVRCLRD